MKHYNRDGDSVELRHHQAINDFLKEREMPSTSRHHAGDLVVTVVLATVAGMFAGYFAGAMF